VWDRGKKKWDKPPIDPATGVDIDATDEANWMTFDEARRVARKQGDGIGIALGPKDNRLGIVGVDPDDCIDPEGNIDPEAMRIVRSLDSYTERTPSGKGLRVLIRGKKPGVRCKHTNRKIEIYEADRYFTVTGRHLEGTPTLIAERQDALDALYHELFGARENPQSKPAGKPNGKPGASDI
jgi:primase-polymerase (primpol)-like protein